MDELNSKISIIFPTYNGEKYLKRTFDSIKNLNVLEEVELIIIDNNSNDSSLDIIDSYKPYINIKLIKQNSNQGFAKACNIGVIKAKSEFIFITNQDVIFPRVFFQKLMKLYKDYKINHEIIISPAIIFEENGIHYFGAKNHFLGFSYTPEIHHDLPKKKVIKRTNRFSGGSLFIKKDLFLKLGCFDPKFFMYYEDTDLSLRAIRCGISIYTTSDPYLIHQKHEFTLNSFRYYLLERNRFILVFKNINRIKKLIPYFIILEIILLFQSIIIKKFPLRIRIYYELLKNREYLRRLRRNSKQELKLLPYQSFSKTLDSSLIGTIKYKKIFEKFLNMLNILLKLA